MVRNRTSVERHRPTLAYSHVYAVCWGPMCSPSGKPAPLQVQPSMQRCHSRCAWEPAFFGQHDANPGCFGHECHRNCMAIRGSRPAGPDRFRSEIARRCAALRRQGEGDVPLSVPHPELYGWPHQHLQRYCRRQRGQARRKHSRRTPRRDDSVGSSTDLLRKAGAPRL